jgi:hypothetical protein
VRPNQYIRTALAVTSALGAIATPVASAHSGQSGWVVRPNADEQTAQPARAGAARPAPSTWVVRPNPDEQVPASSPSNRGYSSPNAPTTIVRVLVPGGGFDWGDAGIGAAGGLAVSLLGIGSVMVVSQRRTRRGGAALTR